MKVSVLFDSKEAPRRFWCSPPTNIVRNGVNPGEPEIVEVHNVIRRGA